MAVTKMKGGLCKWLQEIWRKQELDIYLHQAKFRLLESLPTRITSQLFCNAAAKVA